MESLLEKDFQCDAQCSGRVGPKHLSPSLAGAQVEAGKLCSHDQVHLDPMWHLGRLEERSCEGSQSASSFGGHSGRSDLDRRRKLAFVSGGTVGGASSAEQLSTPAPSRSMGPARVPPARRAMARSPDVASEVSRLLPREQETSWQCEQPSGERGSRKGSRTQSGRQGQGQRQERERQEAAGRGGTTGKLAKHSREAAKSASRVPGSGATTCKGYSLWNSVFSCLSKGRSKLSMIWFSVRAGNAQKRATEGSMWPLPAPFPEMHRRGANRSQCDAARKLAINFVVLVLNFLRSQELHWGKAMPPLGTPLNSGQWAFVRSLAAPRRCVELRGGCD